MTIVSSSICKNCGESFSPRDVRQFCCSKLCSSALWRRSNLKTESRRNSVLKHTYGITLGDWQLMFQNQGGKCKICKSVLTQDYSTDHCHTTKVVRGILCRKCNLGLGYFSDSADVLRAAAKYVQEFYA